MLAISTLPSGLLQKRRGGNLHNMVKFWSKHLNPDFSSSTWSEVSCRLLLPRRQDCYFPFWSSVTSEGSPGTVGVTWPLLNPPFPGSASIGPLKAVMRWLLWTRSWGGEKGGGWFVGFFRTSIWLEAVVDDTWYLIHDGVEASVRTNTFCIRLINRSE